jgi:hypothetical protein
LSPSLEKALMTLLNTVIILLAGAGIYFFVQYFWPLLSSMISTSLIIALPLLFAIQSPPYCLARTFSFPSSLIRPSAISWERTAQ